jgi:hypothetical protein
MVTDGLETCDGDPCAVAAQIHNGNKAITVNVVGLGLGEDELAISPTTAAARWSAPRTPPS